MTRESAQIKGAVIDAGLVGGGIAMCFANAGLPARLIDVSQEARLARIVSALEIFADEQGEAALAPAARLRRLAPAGGGFSQAPSSRLGA